MIMEKCNSAECITSKLKLSCYMISKTQKKSKVHKHSVADINNTTSYQSVDIYITEASNLS